MLPANIYNPDNVINDLMELLHMIYSAQLVNIPFYPEGSVPTDEEIDDAEYVFSGHEVIKAGIPYTPHIDVDMSG